MKVKTLRTVSVVLMLAIMVAIFMLSSQTAKESSNLSGGFIYKMLGIFYPHFESMSSRAQMDLASSLSFIVRKSAHFSIYALLGVMSFFSLITYKCFRLRLRYAISFFICLFYSVSDEFHQIFVTGRSGELRDILIDSTGALLSITLLFLIFYLNKDLRNKIVRG